MQSSRQSCNNLPHKSFAESLAMIADDDQDRLDDDFVDQLANLDQALATGETPISSAGSSPEMQARLKRGMAALKALRHITPAHAMPSTLDQIGRAS